MTEYVWQSNLTPNSDNFTGPSPRLSVSRPITIKSLKFIKFMIVVLLILVLICLQISCTTTKKSTNSRLLSVTGHDSRMSTEGIDPLPKIIHAITILATAFQIDRASKSFHFQKRNAQPSLPRLDRQTSSIGTRWSAINRDLNLVKGIDWLPERRRRGSRVPMLHSSQTKKLTLSSS